MRDVESVKIRALIVDDEPLARRRIKSLLVHDSSVEVIGECSDGYKAVIFISEPLPVGLVMTLISAAILRKRRKQVEVPV